MMAYARHTLLAADHTKYTASAAVTIGNIAPVAALFIDAPPSEELKSWLDEHQTERIVAQEAV